MIKKITGFLLLSILSLLIGCDKKNTNHSSAQNFPEKSIKLIVPWKAGGDTDILYRLVVDELNKKLEHKMIIQNIGGGSGVVGAQTALKAKADGYTLLAAHDSLSITHLLGQAHFNFSSFEPVALIASTHTVLATHPDKPWKNLKDVIKEAQDKPGQMTFAASIGSTSYMEPILIQEAAEIKFNIIAYDGTAERVRALLAQEIDLGMVTLGVGEQFSGSKRLRFLAINSEQRNDIMPELPTMKEQGVNAVSATNRGLVYPKGVPTEAIEFLNTLLQETIETPEFKKKLRSMGINLNYKNAKNYKEFIKTRHQEIEKALEYSGLL